jgi:hypothetical protein
MACSAHLRKLALLFNDPDLEGAELLLQLLIECGNHHVQHLLGHVGPPLVAEDCSDIVWYCSIRLSHTLDSVRPPPLASTLYGSKQSGSRKRILTNSRSDSRVIPSLVVRASSSLEPRPDASAAIGFFSSA